MDVVVDGMMLVDVVVAVLVNVERRTDVDVVVDGIIRVNVAVVVAVREL